MGRLEKRVRGEVGVGMSQMVRSEELRECPFCGGEGVFLLHQWDNPNELQRRAQAGCADSRCRGWVGMSNFHLTPKGAAEVWNRRSYDSE